MATGSSKAVIDTTALSSAFNPRAIAVIGASDNPNKIGGRPLLYLSRYGFKGRVYPINPNRVEVQGFKTYPDIGAVPEVPDLAIVATPGEHAVAAVDGCAARGVKVAIVMASGFGETADQSGHAAERAMVERARAAGMRIVGPNSQGLACFSTGTIASFSTMFSEVEPQDGPIGIVSQSGIMSVVPYGLLRSRGLGVCHAHASGNDADVTLSELAVAVLEDPAVRLLLLYIEAIRDPDILAYAAALARERDVPIVAVKSGRSARGQAAARSHTGALASEDRVVAAFLETHGIWRARDMHELVSAAELYLKGWRPRGRSLVVVSNSGATCVMAADAAQEIKLPLSTFSEETTKALADQLPAFATVTNPIDITAALLNNSRLFSNILPILADSAAADLFFIGIPVAGAGYDVEAFARDTAVFAERTRRPVVVAAPQENVAATFHQAGIPTFSNHTDALAALAQLAGHVRLMRRPRAPAADSRPVHLPPGQGRFLSESQSLAFLESCGLPVLPHRLCRSAADARAAFQEYGERVVVKACSRETPHKSELGLVELDVRTEAETSLAFTRLWDRLGDLKVEREGVIVAPMRSGRREFALGARIDPTFGPVVMLGDGGKYVEVLGDVVLLLPPFTIDDAYEALLGLRIAPILQGVRGEPPLDLDPLCAAAARLGQIMAAGAGDIASIDVNPVLVGALGEGAVIVDALVERAVRHKATAGRNGRD